MYSKWTCTHIYSICTVHIHVDGDVHVEAKGTVITVPWKFLRLSCVLAILVILLVMIILVILLHILFILLKASSLAGRTA
jgi:hypothetical protein